MRRVVIACALAACGRLGFDERGAGGDGGAGDGGAGDGAKRDGAGTGSSSIAIVQQSPVVNGSGPQTAVLPNPTQSGTLLVATIAVNSLSSLMPPTGWSVNVNGSVSGACVSAIATTTVGTAGQTMFTFGLAAGAPGGLQVTEWSGVDLTNPIDAAGFGGGTTPNAALTITTLFAATAAGELAIGSFCEDTNNPTFASGPGWTSLGSESTTAASPSMISEYQLGTPAAKITATATSSATTKYAATILTFRSP